MSHVKQEIPSKQEGENKFHASGSKDCGTNKFGISKWKNTTDVHKQKPGVTNFGKKNHGNPHHNQLHENSNQGKGANKKCYLCGSIFYLAYM